MRFPSPRTLFVAAAAVSSLRAIHSAKAADVGQCFPRQQLIDLMVREGQASVAVADEQQELVKANLTRTLGWIFTKNADGSTGYVVQVDTPASQHYTQGCIVEKLHNVTVDDSRIAELPYGTQISFKATPAVMNDVCSKLPKGMLCGYHNEMLHNMTGDGYRAMYQGTDETGKLILLLGKQDSTSAGVMTLSDLNKGILAITKEYVNTGYTQHGADALKGSRPPP